ncbi:MAG: adenine deaminase [Thermodesulfovibrionales bacterium]|nr:adenine deaminase [Thermodesulfovibrionales bacterium]
MSRDHRFISGNIVDVLKGEIFHGTIVLDEEKIVDIQKEHQKYSHFILPGFIDSHIHIESSMLTPSEFARIASIHGTVAIVSDPHEIANVLGVEGVKYMIEDSKRVPVKFYFGAPSCVPASDFETAGASIGLEELEELLKMGEIRFLAEVMNFPAVINRERDIIEKIELAKKYNKAVDGHAPGLKGIPLSKYISAGISTDHESYQKDEALEKIKLGMKIMIRDGSAAKNFDELISLVDSHFKDCMFCTDDLHPDDLLKGHINLFVKRALSYGIDLMKVLRVACINPVLHYNLDVGLLRIGDPADFIIVDDLINLNVISTYIKGKLVAKSGVTMIPRQTAKRVNNFQTGYKEKEDFFIPPKMKKLNVIKAIDGQLFTDREILYPTIEEGRTVSDVERDLLKIVVINRYHQGSKPSIGFVRGFGLKKGAIASSIAHDSHNLIAVGVTDEDICRAVNLVIEAKGGLSVVSQNGKLILPLPIAGIMSDLDYISTAYKYREINKETKEVLGSTLRSPFMTLSFMALTVIPKLKLSDKGLFDVVSSKFIELFAN